MVIEEYFKLSDEKFPVSSDDLIYQFEKNVEQFGKGWVKHCLSAYEITYFEESKGNKYIVLEKPWYGEDPENKKTIIFPKGQMCVLFCPASVSFFFLNDVHTPCGVVIRTSDKIIWDRLRQGWILEIREEPTFRWFLQPSEDFFIRLSIVTTLNTNECWSYELL